MHPMTDRQYNMMMARIDRIEKLLIEKETAPDLMGTEECAKFLGISKRTLHNRMQERDFPQPIRVGHFNKFRKQDIAAWINKQASPLQALSL
jgi:predicted DNA-binding transcriptional regulator AlpA